MYAFGLDTPVPMVYVCFTHDNPNHLALSHNQLLSTHTDSAKTYTSKFDNPVTYQRR